MTRATLFTLRGIAVAAFIGFMVAILLFTNPQVWRLNGGAGGLTALVEFAVETRNVIALLIGFLILVAAIIGLLISERLGFALNFGAHQAAAESYFKALGFSSTRSFEEVIPAFGSSVYFLGFQLLLLVAIIAGILSLLRVSGRLSSICFISMISIAILGAAGSVLNLPGITIGYFGVPWSETLPLEYLFFTHPVFLVSMICYIYLEASYQFVYFHSLLEPSTVREEQLRRQLTKLRTDARGHVPVERTEVPIPKALQRMLGSDAYRLMRQTIEKKLLRKDWVAEMKEIHEIRRLDSFINRLFQVDPEAEATLTARAASPSLARMATQSIISTVLRFFIIVIVSFIIFYPLVSLGTIPPPIIPESVDFLFLPEKTLFLLLPLSLLFPLLATIIGHIRLRQKREQEQSTTPGTL